MNPHSDSRPGHGAGLGAGHGHHCADIDQQGALNALAVLLKPGGLLAVAEGGLPMRFLPRDIAIGTPGLQARLDAVQEHACAADGERSAR